MPDAQQPATTSGLAAALVAFQTEAPSLPKDATNPHFKSQFVSLDGLMDRVRPVLAKHGLALAQWPTVWDGQPALRSMLIHESGERIEDVMLLMLAKNDPQGQGSAITYARRYAAMSMLGLVGDEDDDGEQTKGKTVVPEPARFQAPAPTGAPAGASKQQHAKLAKVLEDLKDADDSYNWLVMARDVCREKFGKASRADLTSAEMSQLIDEMVQSLESMVAA